MTIRRHNIKKLLDTMKPCPECGGHSLAFCEVSVRFHCMDCGYWQAVNYSSINNAVLMWNNASDTVNTKSSYPLWVENLAKRIQMGVTNVDGVNIKDVLFNEFSCHIDEILSTVKGTNNGKQ